MIKPAQLRSVTENDVIEAMDDGALVALESTAPIALLQFFDWMLDHFAVADAALLRSATEEDVSAALAAGWHGALGDLAHDALLEFWNRMLDQLGVPEAA